MSFNDIKQQQSGAAMGTYAMFDLALQSGKGAVAVDVDGREYIDFTSGIGVNCLGYCEDGWVAAVSAQAARLQHTSNLYYNTSTAALVSRLVELTGMARVFMGNSGAEANECAIKLARKYSYDKYGGGRHEIISLVNSFHGRTMESLTATGQQVMHPECFAPYPEGFLYVNADIESLKAALSDKTCAIMMEMIQGEGGVLPLEQEFVKSVCEIAAQRDILIITDEVQCGMGRTGELLAYNAYGIQPDIVTLAKGLGGGLPIGACLCNERLVGVMGAGTHGSTFGGNPVVCAGALYVLNTISRPEFLNRVRALGEHISATVSGWKNVKSVTGAGLMLGIEVEGRAGIDIARECINNGLIVLTAKTKVRLLPPLNITDNELNRGLDILKGIIEL